MYDTLRIVGVDLGQLRDPTAITIIERGYVQSGAAYNDTYLYQGRTICGARIPVRLEYHVRHLERPALGTSYVDVAERVLTLLFSLRDAPLTLAVDMTGVGRPVGDMLRARLEESLEASEAASLNGKPAFDVAVAWITITGGDTVTRPGDGRGIRVPKRDIASAPLVLMQNGQLKIAENLELAPVLKRELLNFKVEINIATGHDSYEAWREGEHDDLVLAVAMACWTGERYLEKVDSLPRPGAIAQDGIPTTIIGRGERIGR
jgi:hypothetical protein